MRRGKPGVGKERVKIVGYQAREKGNEGKGETKERKEGGNEGPSVVDRGRAIRLHDTNGISKTDRAVSLTDGV